MSDSQHDDKKAGRAEASFELTEDATPLPDTAARALAEHQMEAMEEMREKTAFEIDDSKERRGHGEAAAEEEAREGEVPLVIDPAEAKRVIESVLFVAHEPLRPRDVSSLFRGVSNINARVVRKLLAELVEEYRDKTLQIVEVAEGFRMCTRAELSPWIKRFAKTTKKAKLSQAALETLAILAYKQPITKAEIEEIRRVDCGGVVHTLLERGLIRILGRRDVVGRPIVYGTTPLFLEHFGFKSLSDMPRPEEFDMGEGLAPAGEPGVGIAPEEEATPGGEANGSANGHANGHSDEPGNGQVSGGGFTEAALAPENAQRKASS